MKVSIIIIGDEILNGGTRDTNGPYLIQWALERGLVVEGLRIVGDCQEEIQEALQRALRKSSLILLTGGLGPTLDDKTKGVLGNYWNKKLQENQEAKDMLNFFYKRLGKIWGPEQNSYHLIPEGFFPVENPEGPALGLGFFHEKKLLLAAPGVPKELERMAQKSWPPQLLKFFPEYFQKFQKIMIRTHSLGEGYLFGKLCPSLWKELSHFGKVASLPKVLGVDLTVSFLGSAKEKNKREKEIKKLLTNGPLAPWIWQWGEIPLAQFVFQKLQEKKLTLALAESCTGGLLADRLTNFPGSSEVFLGSVVTYLVESKKTILKISESMLKKFGVVSEEVALEMARRTRKIFPADLSLSLTGFLGPTGGSPKAPVGTVYIGISTLSFEKVFQYKWKGERRKLKEKATEKALFHLLEVIEGDLVVPRSI